MVWYIILPNAKRKARVCMKKPSSLAQALDFLGSQYPSTKRRERAPYKSLDFIATLYLPSINPQNPFKEP